MLRQACHIPSRRQNMNRHLLNHRRWLLTVLLVSLTLSMVLSACNQDSGSGSSTGTTKPPVATAARIQLGPQPCPTAVQSVAHWETIVATSATQKVEGVLCGYLMGVPTLQAVIKVRYGGSDSLLDIAVYDNITGTNPSRIFHLKGLPHGDVGISNYNTLLTGEIDPKSSQQAQVQQDLYREFKWSDRAGMLVQIAFPGIFPD